MPYRKTTFVNNEIYHIINRRVVQKPIFLNREDYQRFLYIILIFDIYLSGSDFRVAAFLIYLLWTRLKKLSKN
jgi:hypothetical protein